MDIATQRRKLQKQRSDGNVQKSALYSTTAVPRQCDKRFSCKYCILSCVSHISEKFLFLEFVVSLFHIFFVEYRFVALSQVLNRYFTIGLISVSYLKAWPLFTSEQQKLTVSLPN